VSATDKEEYFVHYNVWLSQRLVEAVQIGVADPMQGLLDVAMLFKNQGGFDSYGEISCFRYINGEKKERQWHFIVD
jgi:hypothetical protein